MPPLPGRYCIQIKICSTIIRASCLTCHQSTAVVNRARLVSLQLLSTDFDHHNLLITLINLFCYDAEVEYFSQWDILVHGVF